MSNGNIDRPIGGATVAAAQAFLGIPAQNAEKNVGYLSYAMDVDTGIVRAIVSTSITGNPWLNKDGTNSMTGPLHMGGNDMVNANNINANNANLTNNVTANNSVNTPTLNATNANISNNVAAGNNVNATNAVSGGSLQSQSTVSAGTDVVAQRNVQANAGGQGGDMTILNTNAGGANGVPSGPISLAAAVQKPTFVTISNPYVPKPTCPQGMAPNIYALSQNISINGYAPPIGAFEIYTVDGDNSSDTSIVSYPNTWTVVMKVMVANNPDADTWIRLLGYATAYITTNCT